MTLNDHNLSWSGLDVSGLQSGVPRWFEVATLQSMLPDFYTESMDVLSDVSAALTPTLQVIYDVVNVVAQLIPAGSYGTFSSFLVGNLLLQVKRLIADLASSGVFGLIQGPAYGGSAVLAKRFDDSLLNADDQHRPIVSPAGSCGSITFVMGSPTASIVADVFLALGNFLAVSSKAVEQQVQGSKQASGVVDDTEKAPYTSMASSWLPRKNAPHVSWWGYSLRDLVPGVTGPDVVQYLDNMLEYMDRLSTKNPFLNFAVMLLQQIAELTQSLAQMQRFLDDLASVLANGPLEALLIPPQPGGTAAWRITVAKGLQGSYGGPVFGSSSYCGAFTLVVAGADPVKVQAAWEALTRFYYLALQTPAPSRKVGG